MQSHQEWEHNKKYEHHIKCLRDIRVHNRNLLIKSAVPVRNAKRRS